MIVRVYGDEGTPVPIPNTVVKLINGENTWLETAGKITRRAHKADSLESAFFLLEIYGFPHKRNTQK